MIDFELIDDALHHNLVHIEKYDIEYLFGGDFPTYFECQTSSELVEHIKNTKIKAMLLFVKADTEMCEVQEAVKAVEPYCTKECVDGGKILFGAGDETTKDDMKYRALFLF